MFKFIDGKFFMELDIEWWLSTEVADNFILFYLKDEDVLEELKALVPTYSKMLATYWDDRLIFKKIGDKTKKKLLWYIISRHMINEQDTDLPI